MATHDLRRRLAIGGPAVLLCPIAAAQMILASTADLSPWKGGGFGMFASVDGVPFRWVRFMSIRPNAPRDSSLQRRWRMRRAAAPPGSPPRAGATGARGHCTRAASRPSRRTVRIEVWRADVSPALEVSERLVRDLTRCAQTA